MRGRALTPSISRASHEPPVAVSRPETTLSGAHLWSCVAGTAVLANWAPRECPFLLRTNDTGGVARKGPSLLRPGLLQVRGSEVRTAASDVCLVCVQIAALSEIFPLPKQGRGYAGCRGLITRLAPERILHVRASLRGPAIALSTASRHAVARHRLCYGLLHFMTSAHPLPTAPFATQTAPDGSLPRLRMHHRCIYRV